ncbi:uncharacterized protein LOC143258671 isoform X3 [Tachypleus tridentatus]|uniref:uncharacterized protein LOC143258671 isoform X3 n=1 Tax=Tachypleus tridentatus TaxID=6853 RepID=UPI003FD0CDC6
MNKGNKKESLNRIQEEYAEQWAMKTNIICPSLSCCGEVVNMMHLWLLVTPAAVVSVHIYCILKHHHWRGNGDKSRCVQSRVLSYFLLDSPF